MTDEEKKDIDVNRGISFEIDLTSEKEDNFDDVSLEVLQLREKAERNRVLSELCRFRGKIQTFESLLRGENSKETWVRLFWDPIGVSISSENVHPLSC